MPRKSVEERCAYQRAYYAANRDKVRGWQKKWYESHREEACQKMRDGASRRRAVAPWKRMWICARTRANKSGVPFTITPDDVAAVYASHCPILGIAFEHGDGKPHDASPSLDRIIPRLGYVPGNIAVISRRANMIKSNAISAELRRVAEWLELHESTHMEND